MGAGPRSCRSRNLRQAKRLLDDPEVTAREVAHTFGVSRSTLYNNLARLDAPAGERVT